MNLQNIPGRGSSLIAFGRRYGVFIVAALLLAFGGFFLFNGRAEIADATELIRAVSPFWLAVLAALQAATLLITGLTYRIVLRRQGHQIGLFRLIEIHLRRVLIGTVTPVGGPASIYVLVRALRPYGVRDSDALILASIRSIGGVLAFLLFLIPALLLQPPSALVLGAAAGLLLTLGVVLWMTSVTLRQGEIPAVVRRLAPGAVLRFIMHARSHELSARDFVAPAMLSFVSHTMTASMLFAGLNAVGYAASIDVVLIGYVVGKLFFMMAPVFQGIGLVEIGMALALQQAGVPAAVAVSAALLYRVGDLWFPLSWGLIVQLARMPVRERLSTATGRVAGLAARLRGSIADLTDDIATRLAPLSRMALVTEAPLALTFGAVLILVGGLPHSG